MLNYIKTGKRNLLLASFILFSSYSAFSQAFKEYTIGVVSNIGAPHLYKGIVKLATQSDKFKKNI